MKAEILIALLLCLLPVGCGTVSESQPPDSAELIESETDTASGSLVYLQLDPGRQNLMQFDLETRESMMLFAVPANGWLSQMDVSPDGNHIVMAYAPPPVGDEIQFGYSGLYLMLADGETEPRPLIEQANPEEIYFNPVWAPDSRTIYYSHVIPEGDNSFDYSVTLERLDFVTGEIDVIADDAIWPRVSPDGSQVVYVTSQPETVENELVIADADGAHPIRLTLSETFLAVDAPLFSPNGEWLYFSAVTEEPAASLPWFDRLLGVQTAAAHDVPSDWWRIHLPDGAPERLTALNKIGLYGDFGPSGDAMAFASITGLYMMNPDGTQLTQLLETTASDTLSWVP